MSSNTIRILGLVLGGLILLWIGARFAIAHMLSTGGVPPGAMQKTVRSKDGTTIAFEQTGSGPPIVLVSAALVDRDGTRPLAIQLASSWTVLNYDRRGRGQSTNSAPYAIEREVEDIEALVATVQTPVALFGSSSGAVLALDTATHLGTKVSKLFLYEPPFIVDGTRPPITDTLATEIAESLTANNRSQAVSTFFTKGMEIPAAGVFFMRLLMPAWADMTRLAHTAPYDLKILAGTQSGKPLPAKRWAGIGATVLVAVGSKSEPFFHTGALALKAVLPGVEYHSLDGLDHGSVLLSPKDLATAINQNFANPR